MLKKHFTSIFAFILILVMLSCFLLSCQGTNGYYKEIKSTKTESTILAKFGDSKIRYELIRFYFSVFDEENLSFEEVLNEALHEIAIVYATFEICKEYGIDPDSEDVTKRVNDYIKLDIEGGFLNGDHSEYLNGYGSLDAYKAALAKRNCTDYVQRLLYRYSICLSALYQTAFLSLESGQSEVTNELVTNFLFEDSTYHFNLVYIPIVSRDGNREEAREWIETIHQNMIDSDRSYQSLIQAAFRYSYASNSTLLSSETIEFGIYATKDTIDNTLDPTLLNKIQTIQPGEISDIIETEEGFYVVYGMEKSSSVLQNEDMNYELSLLYLENIYYTAIEAKTNTLLSSVLKENKLLSLTKEKIKNGEL